MLIRTTFTHPHPQVGATTDAHLVITLTGEDNPAVQRPKVAVVPVVDTSGSMAAGHKLTIVTRALRHLSEYLSGEDRLGLVTFSTGVTAPVPLTRADAGGLATFTGALATLRASGGTNLYGAIAEGLAEAEDTPGDTLTRVVVLTDGQANAGPTDEPAFAALLATRPAHVTVSFLGVGNDCNHALLGALAETGGGSYGFIETAADAPAVLGAEIGGLLDAEAHHLELDITTRPRYATFTADTPLGGAGTRDGDTMRVSVAQVLRGATRHIVIPVQLHGTGRNHARPVTCVQVTGTAVIDDQPVTLDSRAKVRFTDPAQAADDEMVAIVDLARLSAAIGQARAYAERGDLTTARDLVGGLHLNGSMATVMRESLLSTYNDPAAYRAGTGALSSASAAFTGSLSGSSAAFDALAARTIGSYNSPGQRRYAAETAASVSLDPAAVTTLTLTPSPVRDPAGDPTTDPDADPDADPGAGADDLEGGVGS